MTAFVFSNRPERDFQKNKFTVEFIATLRE
jgi:hypothetical protein